MKAEQRKPYLDLLPLVHAASGWGHIKADAICALCQYAEQDWSEYDGKAYFNCTHPIEAISYAYDKYPNRETGDCWGFRPQGKVDECKRFIETGVWDWQLDYAESSRG